MWGLVVFEPLFLSNPLSGLGCSRLYEDPDTLNPVEIP